MSADWNIEMVELTDWFLASDAEGALPIEPYSLSQCEWVAEPALSYVNLHQAISDGPRGLLMDSALQSRLEKLRAVANDV